MKVCLTLHRDGERHRVGFSKAENPQAKSEVGVQ